MAFITFGTGLSAGLFLYGKLQSGTTDNTGELGHLRFDTFGLVGYGKVGTLEGLCSGGSLASQAI